MPTPNHSTSLLTLLHAAVDGLCACTVFMLTPLMDVSESMMLFVAYNCLAFLTQPFVGIYLDHRSSSILQLVTSIGLLSGGALLTIINATTTLAISPFIIVTLVGMGNSVFHVYGGKFVTDHTGNDIRHLGIFVSSGALGLTLGGQNASITGLSVIALILVVATCLFVLGNRTKESTDSTKTLDCDKPTSHQWLFCFILLVVFFRSFLGNMIPSDAGKDLPFFAMLGMPLAVLGKASGGFLAKRFGLWTTLTTVLLLACICFLCGYYHALFLLGMVLFINLSMPLTLHLANKLFPRQEGFAFGMLAAMLAPGVGLGLLCIDNSWTSDLLYPLIATIVIEALVLLLLRERRWQVLSMSVVMNIMTNLPLNLFVYFCLDTLTVPTIIALEGLVMAVEVFLFSLVTHNKRQAITYGVLCNLTSYLLGLIFTLL